MECDINREKGNPEAGFLRDKDSKAGGKPKEATQQFRKGCCRHLAASMRKPASKVREKRDSENMGLLRHY